MKPDKPRVVLLGAGGHAKVVFDLLVPNFDVVGCTACPLPMHEQIPRLPILGDDTVLPQLLQDGVSHAFVAIGDNVCRRVLSRQVREMGFEVPNAISSFSWLSPTATLDTGVAIMPGVVINADTHVGQDVIVNTGATVDHDCILSTGCSISPGCHLAGSVIIEQSTFLGIGVQVAPKVHIGEGCIIGAGTVVLDDIPPHSFVAGVPARLVRNL